jgi:HlyD family secretion protein
VKWKRWLWIGITAAAVIAAVAYGFRPQPVPVELAEAKAGPLRVTVEEEGKTRVTDRYTVSAPVAGFVRRLQFEIGDVIRPGQIIATIEPPRVTALDPRSRAESEARVRAAEAAVSSAQERVRSAAADVSWAESNLARVRALVKSGDMAQEALDRAQTEYQRVTAGQKSAQFAVETARGELEAARAVLQVSASQGQVSPAELVQVRAPVGGRVLSLIRESEGVVTPGQSLMEIANARSLEVVVEVLSADAVKIAPGMRVLFERWGGPKPLEGRVRSVEPTAFTKISALGVEEQRVRVIVDFVSPREEWSRLGDGYRVEASFILWEQGDVLQVPSSSLFRFEDGWAVFAMAEGKAQRKKVAVGRRNGVAAQVLSGLAAGDRVILHPDDQVTEGKAIVERRVTG